MTKKSAVLTAVRVKAEKTPGYHGDGDGLYLQVTKGGAKSWIFRYTFGGRRREMGDYVFAGQLPRKRRAAQPAADSPLGNPLSPMAMLTVPRRMKRGDLTVHGFRSSFRDWVAEQTDFADEVAEMALAHAVGDKVEAAYRRGGMFERRQQLAEAWGGIAPPAPLGRIRRARMGRRHPEPPQTFASRAELETKRAFHSERPADSWLSGCPALRRSVTVLMPRKGGRAV